MTMRKTILGSLIVLISLISCESQKEEDFRISLNYEHPRQQEYPEANFRTASRPVLPYKHHINVKDFIQKNLYDETTLDSDLKGTVEVPVDVELEVEYKNYSIEAPEVWYESGLSDPFIVGFHSPATRTVTIPVSVNPNHPSQVVEEETIDNETVTTETYILSWSDNFTYRQIATIIQENTYKEFWDNASNYTWDNISIGNPDDMVTCDNSTLVNNAIQNFDKKTNLSKDFKSMVKQTKKELPTVDKDSFVYKNIYKPARDFVSKGIQNLKNDPEFKKIGQKQKELYGPKSKGDIKTNTKEARGTCWHGYQQKGFKKKGNRMVPNCVKEDAMLKIIEGPNDPAIFKAIFTAGGPGSGKTFIVKNTALEGMGYKIVNSDKQFEYYLAQAGLSKGPEQIYSPQGQEIRRKAVDITDKFKTNYIEGRLGLVIDGTGKNLDRIQKQKQDLEKLGYECAMIFVNTNLKSALKRNKFRDRILPDNVVKEMWNQVQENIGNFQRLFKENLFIIDNSEGHNVQKDIDIAFKRLGQWTSKPPKTKQAKAWLDSQVVKELKIVKPDPKNTLGKKRSEMPQIKDEDYGDFIKYMQDNGVTFIAKTLPAKELKPMQKDFSDAGVLKQIKKQMNPDAFKKPVILSSDGYIVDGHHRWLVASNTGKDLDVHQVNLPAEELYTLARKFDKVYYKDVYERGGISVPFSSGLRVGIFPYRPLKIKKSTPGKLRYEGKNDMKISDLINEGKRIPRKKGQPAGSKKHSDLYTDENPKGTIHGLKFATVKDAEASVRKIKSSGKAHAHKIQAAIAMEQRAKAAGKKSAAAVYRRYINKMKKKTKKMKEATEQLSLVLEQLQGQGYEKGNRIVNGRT